MLGLRSLGQGDEPGVLFNDWTSDASSWDGTRPF